MHRTFALIGTSTLAVLAFAGPLRADVTPQQVWDDLSAYMQSFGYTVTATESGGGTDLTVNDVLMSMDMPDGTGSVSFAMSQVVLADRGDGTVQVTFPESMPIRFTVDDADAEDVEARIDYQQSGLEMIVSGSPSDMVYDYTADTLSMSLAELKVEGEVVPREMARGVFSMSGVTGQSTVETGDSRDIAQTMTMTGASYDVAFSDPDNGGKGLFKGSMENLSFAGRTSLPMDVDATDMAAMLGAGASGGGTFRYENGKTEFAAEDGGAMTTGTITSETAQVGIDVSDQAMSYDIGNTGLSLNITSADMPFPLAAEMARTQFNITMPVAKAEEPQDFALGLTLGGFTMSEMLWNIFDPGAALPRDPATVSANMTGTATPFVNMFDPEAMTAIEQSGEAPGELNSLTLTDLTVQAAGAKLTGEGAFEFDNSDLETFDGMPAPTGTLNLMLTGSNALIDKLIAMGLLAQEDAMGARMMMSMFTVPSGDDELSSTIEVNDQGHVLANGQRIR